MSVDVVILGCGPSGLAAATAVVRSGLTVMLVSNTDRRSRQYGCQYLHAPVPGYEQVPHTVVNYTLRGTPEQYRYKVYGDGWMGKVSPEDFVGEHEAWDIRMTYSAMWMHLHETPGQVQFLIAPTISDGELPTEVRRANPSVMISTIPAPALCSDRRHIFRHHVIYATGSMTQENSVDDTIVCDGTDEHTWYRSACVFGYRTTEWSQRPSNGESLAAVAKPLSTDCTCHPEISRIGRYGKWEKSYLVHKAYPEVMEILK